MEDVEGAVLDLDVVWVMGGSVANLPAVWRVHDLDRIMRRAWEAGVVLSGVSSAIRLGEGRRPLIHQLVADGTLPTSHRTDDGVGLVSRGTKLVEAVTGLPGKGAYVVTREGDAAVEERIEPRKLPTMRHCPYGSTTLNIRRARERIPRREP
ncbi:hypothetical protein F0344_15265 [Streptomyces finlayi]|uniref:Uncharacterized protein n=1 Tax=Streptomyces finlayi TaxID=67296 RepID=A0A7G7BKE3_9ACTN|nr:hypothetical protein F0344_15265 [Streptomyces finlayi]